MTKSFSDIAFEFDAAENVFEHKLIEADDKFDYSKLGWDSYDCSLEIYGVHPDYRMSEAVQKVISGEGFIVCYVNHTDGWETHYGFTKNLPDKGWRRKRTEKGFEISEWPEGWKGYENWLKTGYMTIVPDPLEKKDD